jgi:hypothetical protein
MPPGRVAVSRGLTALGIGSVAVKVVAAADGVVQAPVAKSLDNQILQISIFSQQLFIDHFECAG